MLISGAALWWWGCEPRIVKSGLVQVLASGNILAIIGDGITRERTGFFSPNFFLRDGADDVRPSPPLAL